MGKGASGGRGGVFEGEAGKGMALFLPLSQCSPTF